MIGKEKPIFTLFYSIFSVNLIRYLFNNSFSGEIPTVQFVWFVLLYYNC